MSAETRLWQLRTLPWSEYPAGTYARASNGMSWMRTANGWLASGGDTFPTPAADAHEVRFPSVPASPSESPDGGTGERTDERWCVIFKRDAEPIDYTEGTPAEMFARYERLAVQWTGVVLCKILVPDASTAEMGEARARFDALRRALAHRGEG